MPLPTITLLGEEGRTLDLCQAFGLVWTNDGALAPPHVRMASVEVPGMDGTYDATEWLTGAPQYQDRTQEFVFYVAQGRDFEAVKEGLCRVLHGQRREYTLSVDPGYCYTGRWDCDSYHSTLNYREVKFVVTAEPWKRRLTPETASAYCAGGAEIPCHNGGRRVNPTFTTKKACLVEYGGRAWEVPGEGEWVLDLALEPGESSVWVDTAPDVCTATWDDVVASGYESWSDMPAATRWADLFHLGRPPAQTERDLVRLDWDVYEL